MNMEKCMNGTKKFANTDYYSNQKSEQREGEWKKSNYVGKM
jgi:hypothetical protein